MDIRQRIREVLKKGYLMSLGTQDKGGPWVADVIYTFDEDFNIYWMSLPQVRHSKAVEAAGAGAASITVTSYGEKPELGIQLHGRAERVESIPWEAVLAYFSKQGEEEPDKGEDLLGEHHWYVLRPRKIDLNDTANFGWNKQSLEL